MSEVSRSKREASKRIVEMQLPAEISLRMEWLANRQREGTLTDAELREIEALVRSENLLSEMRSIARHWLESHPDEPPTP